MGIAVLMMWKSSERRQVTVAAEPQKAGSEMFEKQLLL